MSLHRKIFAADDWGFSPGINAGILRLARLGWLKSVSCAANAPYLTEGLDELLAANTDVSLHFNLTYGRPLTHAPSLTMSDGAFLSHKRLMWRGLFGGIAAPEVRAELIAQLDRLRDLGLNVDGLDGHHHVHLLPWIAKAIAPELPPRGIRRVRVLLDPQHPFSYLQSRLFKVFYAPQNSLEPCLYLLPRHLHSRRAFQAKLAAAHDTPLLVHPALYNDFEKSGMLDKMRDYRVFELETVLRYLHD